MFIIQFLSICSSIIIHKDFFLFPFTFTVISLLLPSLVFFSHLNSLQTYYSSIFSNSVLLFLHQSLITFQIIIIFIYALQFLCLPICCLYDFPFPSMENITRRDLLICPSVSLLLQQNYCNEYYWHF